MCDVILSKEQETEASDGPQRAPVSLDPRREERLGHDWFWGCWSRTLLPMGLSQWWLIYTDWVCFVLFRSGLCLNGPQPKQHLTAFSVFAGRLLGAAGSSQAGLGCSRCSVNTDSRSNDSLEHRTTSDPAALNRGKSLASVCLDPVDGGQG